MVLHGEIMAFGDSANASLLSDCSVSPPLLLAFEMKSLFCHSGIAGTYELFLADLASMNEGFSVNST